MMKNVYYLASTVQKEKFRLDVKYRSDTTGVYISYIPEAQVKGTPIIKLLGADRLDNNNKANSNGYFDFVEGYTVSNGRVFFPRRRTLRILHEELSRTAWRGGSERGQVCLHRTL